MKADQLAMFYKFICQESAPIEIPHVINSTQSTKLVITIPALNDSKYLAISSTIKVIFVDQS